MGSSWHWLIALATCGAVVACSDRAGSPPGESVSSAQIGQGEETPATGAVETTQQQCRAGLADYRGWLGTLRAEGPTPFPTSRAPVLPAQRRSQSSSLSAIDANTVRLGPELLEIPSSGPSSPAGDFAVTAMDDHNIEYRQLALSALTAFGKELARARWNHLCDDDKTEITGLIVWATPDAPWRLLEAVAATATAAGVDELWLVYEIASNAEVPGPSWVQLQISQLELANSLPFMSAEIVPTQDQPTIASRLAERIFAHCPEGLDVYAKGDSADPESMARAISDCDCRVDLTALKALHWWDFGRWPQGTTKVALKIPLKAESGTILRSLLLPADTSLQEATAELVEALGGGAAVRLQTEEGRSFGVDPRTRPRRFRCDADRLPAIDWCDFIGESDCEGDALHRALSPLFGIDEVRSGPLGD